jgi:hypothetical protein
VSYIVLVISISVSVAAFEAVAATLPLGSVGFEREATGGDYLIWLEPHVLNRLRAMRRPGESYSDVILRLVEIEARVR